jgi:hypothetical protein
VLRFIDNHRLRVTLEWFDYLAAPASSNTCIVDLDQAIVQFPPQFANPVEFLHCRWALRDVAKHPR